MPPPPYRVAATDLALLPARKCSGVLAVGDYGFAVHRHSSLEAGGSSSARPPSRSRKLEGATGRPPRGGSKRWTGLPCCVLRKP